MIKVLFVCTGNICRSPTAEVVFRKMVEDAGISTEVQVASAGTHGYHVGEPPDARAKLAAKKRGYDMSAHVARQITLEDYRDADFILAMDWENLTELQRQCPPMLKHKLHLLMRYASEYDAAVIPDPYYGSASGFNLVLDYCEDACQGLLEIVKRRVSMYAPSLIKEVPEGK